MMDPSKNKEMYMQCVKRSESGFALIGVLLLLLLVSALAVSLTYMVNSEAKVGGSDLENNLAFYGAESGMEKMTADLSAVYTKRQAPTVNDITAINALLPVIPGVTYPTYAITVPNNAGVPISQVRNLASGPNQGLVAQIIPMTLNVVAQRTSGAQAKLSRTVEVALIPVFQFGVFSDSDLSFFPGPTFTFAGRIHTNGNLFLADNNGITFFNKVTVAKDVIRDILANGVSSATRTGAVNIPTAPSGCPNPKCRDLKITEGSRSGGVAPGGTVNTNWATISLTTYGGMLVNSATGAKPLVLPFVAPGLSNNEIVRQPVTGENPNSLVGQSRCSVLSPSVFPS